MGAAGSARGWTTSRSPLALVPTAGSSSAARNQPQHPKTQADDHHEVVNRLIVRDRPTVRGTSAGITTGYVAPPGNLANPGDISSRLARRF